MTVSVVVLFLLFFLKIIKLKSIIITIKLDHVSFVTEKMYIKSYIPLLFTQLSCHLIFFEIVEFFSVVFYHSKPFSCFRLAPPPLHH